MQSLTADHRWRFSRRKYRIVGVVSCITIMSSLILWYNNSFDCTKVKEQHKTEQYKQEMPTNLTKLINKLILERNLLSTDLYKLGMSSRELTKFINQILSERNLLSKKLNAAMKDIGKLQCEKKETDTNNQGGWCKSASYENGGQHMTDTKVILALSEFLQNKTVGSFGDGPGAYKREILKRGQVKLYEAYDGAPYCEETSNGRVNFLDLTIPQFGIPLYDWILSVEVAEHIPSQYELIYLDNLFRHAKEGIILSWAVPGQDGLNHINNKPFDYVINIMKANGFTRDEQSSRLLQNSATFQFMKSNLNVYRKNLIQNDADKFTASWFL